MRSPHLRKARVNESNPKDHNTRGVHAVKERHKGKIAKPLKRQEKNHKPSNMPVKPVKGK